MREYAIGDEVRYLHWKATARTGRLMVREYADPAQPRFTTVLDTRRAAMSPAVFEEAVEVAASLFYASASAGQHCRLVTSTGADTPTDSGLGAARVLLDELALVTQNAAEDVPLLPSSMAAARRPGGSLERHGGSGMTALDRVAGAGLLGSTGVAGLLFAPVFGLSALLVPVLVVVAIGYGSAELTAQLPKLAPYRPFLVLLLGLLGLIETVLTSTTFAFLPTGASLAGLAHGFTEGWQLTLQSTWPARPVPEQLLFVPMTVLLAVVLGLELLLRLRKPLVALLIGRTTRVIGRTTRVIGRTTRQAARAIPCFGTESLTSFLARDCRWRRGSRPARWCRRDCRRSP